MRIDIYRLRSGESVTFSDAKSIGAELRQLLQPLPKKSAGQTRREFRAGGNLRFARRSIF